MLRLDALVEMIIGMVELGAFGGLGFKAFFAGADGVAHFLGWREGGREQGSERWMKRCYSSS